MEKRDDIKIKDIQKKIILVILFSACFNEILRIPGTSISLFRILLPISCIILLLHTKIFKKICIFSGVFFVISLLQNLLFYNFIEKNIHFKIEIYIYHLFFYICIIIIFALVLVFRNLDQMNFNIDLSKFIFIIGLIQCMIMASNILLPNIMSAFNIDNINNYSCCITGWIAIILYLFRKTNNKFLLFFIGLGLLIMIVNDSKASLAGTLIMITIYVCVSGKNNSNLGFMIQRFTLPFLFLILLLVIYQINPTINGYSFQTTFFEPIKRVLHNMPYESYQTSIMYRTNTTIFAIQEFCKSLFLGVGFPNTSLLIGHYFPYATTTKNPEFGLSLHNAWLELLLDGGIIVLITYFFIISYGIKMYVKRKQLKDIEIIRVIFIFSFPFWSIGPSGILSLYSLYIIMGILIFAKE